MEEIRRLDEIATDLLSEKSRRAPVRCDLIALIRRVVDLIAVGQSEHPAPKIHLQLPSHATLGRAFPDLLKQVLWNVLLNAEQAAAGNVWIRLALEGDQVAVEIEDDGPGLGTAKAESNGIGLSLCEKLVEEHGGKLAFGASPRGGALVRILLPSGVAAEATT